MKKKIIIHNGNISIGGQERMLIEFLKVLDPMKYEVLLLIEEDNGDKNTYIDEIPHWIEYKFLTSQEFMKKLIENKNKKNLIGKILYSYMLKKKKQIAIKNFNKYINFSNTIIDYDMGLIRNLHKLDLNEKIIVGWSHAGNGGKFKSKQKNRNIEKYDYIVAINEEMKKGYEKNTTNPKIIKINNFIDMNRIKKLSEEPLPMEYQNLKYIISVGSLTENKNHILLIEAFYKLKTENKVKEKLFIIGEGKEKAKLEQRIKELKMEDEIFLLGAKKNPYNFIKNAEICVVSSYEESFSLTAAEAMVLKTMVISTPTNGTIELLQTNDKNGKILINRDIEELSINILFYLKNKFERDECENNAFERIKNFDRSFVVKNIEEFIDKL